MKALVGAFHQEKALVGAFSVIVKSSLTWCWMRKMTMFMQPMKLATCSGVRPDSVVASMLAPYFSSSSTTLIRGVND